MTTDKSSNKPLLFAAAFGLSLGFTLNRTGFSSFDELHKMLTFDDLRLFLTFLGAVSSLALAYLLVLNSKLQFPDRGFHKGSIVGGVIFGVGWAVTGACPAVPLVQIGEGKVWALITLIGVALGVIAYEWAHKRWFQWDRGRC